MSLPDHAASSSPDLTKGFDDSVIELEDRGDLPVPQVTSKKGDRGLRFWLIVLALCISVFLSALENSAVSTALPTIVQALDGNDFVWVASAYSLAATALLPATGGMAQIFGRRAVMMASLGTFALGSALCGAAQNMNWLIAARTVQGAGGGGMLATSSIIMSDLVPLKERAIYQGLIGMTWAVAASLGPLVGGAFAEHGQWRWLFYMNLPVIAAAALLVAIFVDLKTPEGSILKKLARIDFMGNFLIISSSTAVVIGLSWGGVRYPWTSAHVLAPLIIGLIGIVVFIVYEAKVAKEPIVPISLLSNRTTLSGYIQTFICPVIGSAFTYFMPVYFQACQGASPIKSGVNGLAFALILGVFLMTTGVSIAVSKQYRVQLWTAWVCFVIASGLMVTVHAETPLSRTIGFTAFLGFACGILYSSTYYPVLAPLSVSDNAHALALFAFFRSFAAVWGVTIGTAILQTQLSKRLPQAFIKQSPKGVSIAYAIIPVIQTLEEPLRSEVRAAFADSISVMWEVMVGIAGIGLLSSLFMKGLPLHTQVDESWGMEDKNRSQENINLELTRSNL